MSCGATATCRSFATRSPRRFVPHSSLVVAARSLAVITNRTEALDCRPGGACRPAAWLALGGVSHDSTSRSLARRNRPSSGRDGLWRKQAAARRTHCEGVPGPRTSVAERRVAPARGHRLLHTG